MRTDAFPDPHIQVEAIWNDGEPHPRLRIVMPLLRSIRFQRQGQVVRGGPLGAASPLAAGTVRRQPLAQDAGIQMDKYLIVQQGKTEWHEHRQVA